MKVLILLVLSTVSLSAFAESIEETNCKKTLAESAYQEATMLLGEGYFPPEVLRQIDWDKEFLCSAQIVPGSFKIEDRSSEVCQATARYRSECLLPKKGGGLMDESINSSGHGCCMIETPATLAPASTPN